MARWVHPLAMSGDAPSERSGRSEERGPSAQRARSRARTDDMSGDAPSERSGRSEERGPSAQRARSRARTDDMSGDAPSERSGRPDGAVTRQDSDTAGRGTRPNTERTSRGTRPETQERGPSAQRARSRARTDDMSGDAPPAGAPISVLAVDDEPPALDELVYLLDKDPNVDRVVAAHDGTDALRVLEGDDIDAVVLDIRMPGLSGLDLARVLARFRRPPVVLFVTAYDEHAVDAFDVRAVDYVMKPYRPDRLAEAIRRAVVALDVASRATPHVVEEIDDESIPDRKSVV